MVFCGEVRRYARRGTHEQWQEVGKGLHRHSTRSRVRDHLCTACSAITEPAVKLGCVGFVRKGHLLGPLFRTKIFPNLPLLSFRKTKKNHPYGGVVVITLQLHFLQYLACSNQLRHKHMAVFHSHCGLCSIAPRPTVAGRYHRGTLLQRSNRMCLQIRSQYVS